MTYSIGLLANTLAQFLQIYLVLMIIRVLLSWFPNINWYDPPFSILSHLGGIDFSPMIAFFVLQFGSQILIGLLGSLQTAF
ncbi:MAG: YggT family protein [Oscillatoriales cyanobacterium]|nr:MAG: YggT family protein [Oscillatoriales cyanobacterium]